MGGTPLVFQTFAWETDDGIRDGDNVAEAKFSVQMFGKTADGQSVSIRVDSANGGFMPSFAIQVPEDCADQDTYEKLFEILKGALVIYDFDNAEEGKPPEKIADLGDHLVAPDEPVVRKVNLWGFTNRKEVPFFTFAFTSDKAYRMALGKFRACHRCRLSVKDLRHFVEDYKALDRDLTEVPWNERQEARAQIYEEKKDLIEKTHNEREVSESLLRWVLKLDKQDLPLELAKVKLFEVLDHSLRFAHMGAVRPAGWISVEDYDIVPPDEQETTCAIEANCNLSDLRAVEQDTICPTLKEMSFDIEAYSHDDAFPDPMHPENSVFQIAVTIKEYVQTADDMKKFLLHLMPTGSSEISLPGVVVYNFRTERELLLKFRDIILEEDPDILWGWNTDQFDWAFLMKRADVIDCLEEFNKLSRKRDFTCVLEKEEFRSSAQGDNEYERVKIPGRLNFDAMVWVKRNIGSEFPDHKLDTVASMKLGETKRDVHHREIFAAFRSAETARCAVIGDYCVQDTALVQKLVVKLNMVAQIMAMSNITDTPPTYLMTKGQQIKCLSIIAKRARAKGYFVPVADARSGDSFEGAIVLEPKVGIHDTPTVCLDFASLYPSIQMAYQVCYTTIVLIQCPNCKKGVGRCQRDEGVECYDNLPGVRYETFEWDEDVIVHTNPKTKWRRTFNSPDAAKKITGIAKKVIKDAVAAWQKGKASEWSTERIHRRYRFAHEKTSIIPTLQMELKKSRSAVRKIQATITNLDDHEEKLRYSVLDGQQLSRKLMMNSIYGFCSAFTLNLTALSACVTARGRQMITRCVTFAERDFQGIANTERWSESDTDTWITDVGREVVTKTPEKSWLRKFPCAVVGQPWSWGKDLGANIVGGDTDSVFCNFANCTNLEAISLGHKAAEYISRNIFARPPIELEYERVFIRMYIQGRKQYNALVATQDDVRLKRLTKGLASKRRNYCPMVQKMLADLLDAAIGAKTIGKSVVQVPVDREHRGENLLSTLQRYLEKYVSSNAFDWQDMVITSALRSFYANENLPHVQFARRMNEREKGGGPRVGERFGYVFVHASADGDDTEVVAEDPIYAQMNNLQPNKCFYLNHQLRGALTSVLKVVGWGAQAENLFNILSLRLHEGIKAKRRKREQDAKLSVLSGKMPPPVKPLKKAKVQNKLSKFAQDSCGHSRPITQFFIKTMK